MKQDKEKGYMEVIKMFGKTQRATECACCGKNLKKHRKENGIVHCCSACIHIIELFERKAKRIFGA